MRIHHLISMLNIRKFCNRNVSRKCYNSRRTFSYNYSLGVHKLHIVLVYVLWNKGASHTYCRVIYNQVKVNGQGLLNHPIIHQTTNYTAKGQKTLNPQANIRKYTDLY